jgi:hypothetical protein
MEGDYQDNSGFGSFAWYQLGRWSAEGDQSRKQLVARLTGREPVARVVYDQAVDRTWELAAENQVLAAENRSLSEEIAGLKRSIEIWRDDHERLDKWAHERAAEAEIWKGNYWALKNRS